MKTPEELAALRAELGRLNDAVVAATEARTAWLDAHMADFALWPIGAVLYDLKTGELFGVVVEYYRYHQYDPLYDHSMDVNYRVSTPGGMVIDNTSRFGGAPQYRFGTAEERRGYLERELAHAR